MKNKWTNVWINLICHQIFNPLSTVWPCTDLIRSAIPFIPDSSNPRSHASSESLRTMAHNDQWLLPHAQDLHHKSTTQLWPSTWFEYGIHPAQRRSQTFIGYNDHNFVTALRDGGNPTVQGWWINPLGFWEPDPAQRCVSRTIPGSRRYFGGRLDD